MNLGEAAEQLAQTVRTANAGAGTQQGNICRRHIISAIKDLSAIEFDFNVFEVDVNITGGLNDYTFGGAAGQALPTGALAPVRLYFYRSPSGHSLEKVTELEMLELNLETPTASDEAEYWCWRNNAVRVYPVPTTNWVLRGFWLRDGMLADITYSGSTPTFPADSVTSIWLAKGPLEIVINQAAAYYYLESGRPDLAQGHAQAVENKRVPVAKVSTRRRSQGHLRLCL